MSNTRKITITLPDDVLSRIELLALAWQVDESEAVARLLRHFEATGRQSAASTGTAPGQVAVHALYGGQRFEGLYDTATKGLSIAAGPAAGAYRTPSGAASAVVQAVKPGVAAARNGWSFWVISDTGAALQTLR